jgi:hypothetical protein
MNVTVAESEDQGLVVNTVACALDGCGIDP